MLANESSVDPERRASKRTNFRGVAAGAEIPSRRAPGLPLRPVRSLYSRRVKFGPWFRLAEASERVPAAPGVLQLRVERGLVRYPRGKSAMIRYVASADVRQVAEALARAHPGAPWLCRASVGACADPDAAAARLIAEFEERFGSCPFVPDEKDMA